MKKSMYSITLLDDVVRGIDRVAYLNGTSRSGMINRILAEYLRMSTPETRARRIISELGRAIEDYRDFRIHGESSGSLFAVKSSLSFKYNPTIRYSVALYQETGEFFGELRAVLRTQNTMLISRLELFFELWHRIETGYLDKAPRAVMDCGRYTRKLRVPDMSVSADELGRAAAGYIRVLHDGMSAYFAALPDVDIGAARMSQIYDEYARSGEAML